MTTRQRVHWAIDWADTVMLLLMAAFVATFIGGLIVGIYMIFFY